MKKSERLNHMMLYLANRSTFNLNDLVQEYTISRRTALRDIESLEQIGFPIYSNRGKYGGYGILPNRLKYHFEFTADEIAAIYFAVLTLSAYQSTPFHINALKLIEKFKTTLPDHLRDKLVSMSDSLTFESTRHLHESPLLNQLLTSIPDQQVLDVSYSSKDMIKSYSIQVIGIISRFGQWYVQAMDRTAGQLKIFRCDKIIALRPSTAYDYLDRRSIDQWIESAAAQSEREYFRLEIDKHAVDRFYKEAYPSMSLIHDNDHFYITGYYTKEEKAFIAGYVLSFGSAILAIDSDDLRTTVMEALNTLNQHYKDIGRQ